MNVLEAAWDHALYFHLIVCDNNLHLRQKGLSSALDLVVCFCGFVGWVFVYLCFVVLVGFFFFLMAQVVTDTELYFIFFLWL